MLIGFRKVMLAMPGSGFHDAQIQDPRLRSPSRQREHQSQFLDAFTTSPQPAESFHVHSPCSSGGRLATADPRAFRLCFRLSTGVVGFCPSRRLVVSSEPLAHSSSFEFLCSARQASSQRGAPRPDYIALGLTLYL